MGISYIFRIFFVFSGFWCFWGSAAGLQDRKSWPRAKTAPTAVYRTWTPLVTCWTFRIFFIFFPLGEGKGESEAPGRGGGRCFIENPRRGGSPTRGGGGAGRVSAGNLGGGGLNTFFGAEMPTKVRIEILQGSFGPFGPKVAKRVRNEFPWPLALLGGRGFSVIQHAYSTWQLKEAFFGLPNPPPTPKMAFLLILSYCIVFWGVCKFQNIQHIQHIQHGSWKKHFCGAEDSTGGPKCPERPFLGWWGKWEFLLPWDPDFGDFDPCRARTDLSNRKGVLVDPSLKFGDWEWPPNLEGGLVDLSSRFSQGVHFVLFLYGWVLFNGSSHRFYAVSSCSLF